MRTLMDMSTPRKSLLSFANEQLSVYDDRQFKRLQDHVRGVPDYTNLPVVKSGKILRAREKGFFDEGTTTKERIRYREYCKETEV